MTDTRKLTMDDLESVYLDGFCSGLATFATNFAANEGMGTEQADAFANFIAQSIRNDPAGLAEVRRQIIERITDPNCGDGEGHNIVIKTSGMENGAIADGPPYVHGRDFVVGERWPTSEPRTWDNLRKVPDDVQRVTNRGGDLIVRDSSAGHGWGYPTGVHLFGFQLVDGAPYTEVIDRG